MDPKFISIKNFMSHKSTKVDCTKFQSALIMGQSNSDPRESNGVGKTAIFSAIEYALFGTYSTSVLDGIVRDGTDLCQVVFDFELDESIYRVQRERKRGKSSDCKLAIQSSDGAWKDLSKRTASATHNEIQKLIKINSKVFRNSVLFSQNDLDGLASAKSADDRKAILKEALNLNDYKKLENIAKEKSSVLSRQIIALKAVIDSLGDPSEDIDSLNIKLKESKKKVSELSTERDKLQVSLNSKKAELSDTQRSVTSEMSNTEQKLQEVCEQIEIIVKQIRSDKEIVEANSQKLKTLFIKLETKQSELTQIEQSCNELRAKKARPLDKVKKKYEEVSNNELNGKSFIGSLESKANELRKPLPDGDECPTCAQEVTNEYRSACENDKKKKLIKLENDLAKYRNELKKVSNHKAKLKKEIDDIINTFSKIASLEGSISSKKSEIVNDKDYIERLKKLNDQANADISIKEQSLVELNSRKVSLNELLSSISNDDVNLKIIEIKNTISTMEKFLQSLMQEASDANSQVGGIQAKIENRHNDLEKIQESLKILEKIQEEHLLYKEVRKAFSSSGIPTMVIHTILDDLQIAANNILSELKPGHELQFTPDLEISFRIQGREREYRQLSGGQKMLMAFSLKIGLSLVIQNRLGINLKFLGLDEVDQSLDKSAVDHYAEIIRKLQDRFKVFVITHNDALKDKFSNVILVEGDGINGATSSVVTY